MEHKITTENILKAAEKCPQAKETLKTMFPEAFASQSEYFDLNPEGSCERNIFKNGDEDVYIKIANGLAPNKELRDKCFYLSTTCNWKIEGSILIPTRK